MHESGGNAQATNFGRRIWGDQISSPKTMNVGFGGNQALGFDSTTDVLFGISHVLKILLTAAFESSLILLKLKPDVATL